MNDLINQTNQNYYDLVEKINRTEKELNNAIFDTKQKLYTTENTLIHLNEDKDYLDKNSAKFEQENIQHQRLIEKNHMFYQDPQEKNDKIKKEVH